jgi:hypothetical protein
MGALRALQARRVGCTGACHRPPGSNGFAKSAAEVQSLNVATATIVTAPHVARVRGAHEGARGGHSSCHARLRRLGRHILDVQQPAGRAIHDTIAPVLTKSKPGSVNGRCRDAATT